MAVRILVLLLLLCVWAIGAPGGERVLLDKPRFEFNFGSSQLYLFGDLEDASGAERRSVLPASAALLTGEYFFDDELHGLVGIHLPTSTRKRVDSLGRVQEDYVAPFLGVGPLWVPYAADFRTYARFSVQASLLCGPVLRSGWDILPAAVLGSRLHLVSKNGTTLFLGGSWTVGVQAFALLYGVGQRF